MRIRSLNVSLAVLTAASMTVASPAAADEKWIVETQDNSAGFTHTHTEVVDPVPEAGGGSYEGGSGGREGVVEQEREDPCAGVPEARRGSCAVAWRGLGRPGG